LKWILIEPYADYGPGLYPYAIALGNVNTTGPRLGIERRFLCDVIEDPATHQRRNRCLQKVLGAIGSEGKPLLQGDDLRIQGADQDPYDGYKVVLGDLSFFAGIPGSSIDEFSSTPADEKAFAIAQGRVDWKIGRQAIVVSFSDHELTEVSRNDRQGLRELLKRAGEDPGSITTSTTWTFMRSECITPVSRLRTNTFRADQPIDAGLGESTDEEILGLDPRAEGSPLP
jgi:hypothetical protein